MKLSEPEAVRVVCLSSVFKLYQHFSVSCNGNACFDSDLCKGNLCECCCSVLGTF